MLQMTPAVDLTGQEQIGEAEKLWYFWMSSHNVNLWIMSGFKRNTTRSEDCLDVIWQIPARSDEGPTVASHSQSLSSGGKLAITQQKAGELAHFCCHHHYPCFSCS